MDHDQRFKVMLQDFFSEFMQLFLPHQSALFDFSKITWVQNELFADPPAGTRSSVDLVAQVATWQSIAGQRPDETDSMLALIHIEIEHADSVKELRGRMYRYYEQLRRRYKLAVLPVALYLQVGLDGIGIDAYEEFFETHRTLHFEYMYIGLPALDAQTYADGDSPLGISLSSLMRCAPKLKVELAAKSLKRLVEWPLNDWQRWLLCDCLVAYSNLNKSQWLELEQIMASEPNRSAFPITPTWFDRGMEQGLQQGIQEGLQLGLHQGMLEMIRTLLEERFGTVSDNVQRRLESLSAEQLKQLSRELLKAESLRELGLDN